MEKVKTITWTEWVQKEEKYIKDRINIKAIKTFRKAEIQKQRYSLKQKIDLGLITQTRNTVDLT